MSTEKKIIFTTEKNISPKDKEKLCKNGFLVIECKSLAEIKYSQDFDSNIILTSSMFALATKGQKSTQALFFREVYRKMFPKNPPITEPTF